MTVSDPLWAEGLSLANVALALLLVVMCGLLLGRTQKSFRWGIWLCIMVGLYWAGLYVFVLLTPAGSYDPVWFGRVFVRPAFTVTLAVMASIALYRYVAGTPPPAPPHPSTDGEGGER